jgi:vanillate/4-hydroxybenzoate decarboxylase subunit C
VPYSDLRSYLDALNANGQLLSITEKVKAEPDLSAAAVAGLRMSDRSPAPLFDNIEGFTNARVALNTIGSWANLATALEVDIKTPVRDMFFEWVRRAENFPIAVERRDNPPWTENSVEGDDINLFDILPLFRLNAADGGFFLDNGAVVSRDPDDPDNFGKQNVGCYRMQVPTR